MTNEGRRAAQRARAERHRERRRNGRTLVSLEVTYTQRHALLQLGLIEDGLGNDPAAVSWAVTRFLDAAPSIVALGNALYPTSQHFAEAGGE